ncbi:MAG: ParB N-terminal domain-containing protein [Massilibacteroides sp.]|nr:ParB N-terminal domain-containing protein [Massilibacteroides sp.]
MQNNNLKIENVLISDLHIAQYNPRKHTREQMIQLQESIKRFGVVDPVILNGAPERLNIVIGGHMRLQALHELGETTVPAVYVHITDIEKEKELNLRLNKNTGEFDYDLLASFDESFLKDVGFSSEELDDIFPVDETTDQFNLQKELDKLNITEVKAETGDI